MIISKIFMGLGNQMFQYAAGRALSLHHNVPFKVDVSSYTGYHVRSYELDKHFISNPAVASTAEIEQYKMFQLVKTVWNKGFPNNKMKMLGLPYEENGVKGQLLSLVNKFSPAYSKNIYIEPHYHFDSNFFRASDNAYLIGYWMSWKYFEKYNDVIKADFTIKPELTAHLNNVVSEVRNTNSIGMHIRRGDFASAKNQKIHGLVPLDYYHKAIEHIKIKTGEAIVYVFSDDVDWVKENFNSDVTTVVASNSLTKSPIEDLYLMSQCRHNIIANSTFSWWAAYLNNNHNKIVVAPKKWYNDAPYDYKDVYPLTWHVM